MSDVRSPAVRILVVEDHDELADALTVNLTSEGYAVECARSGREALLSVRSRVPDLILLDLHLPRLNGFEVLRELRGRGIWCPVLILSALGTMDDKLEGFRLGADDYVTKPFTLAELLCRVRALLRRTSGGGESAGAESSGGAAGGASTASASTGAAPAVGASAAGAPNVIGFSDEELVARFRLTQRQATVARMLAHGLTNVEIAESLGITRLTARNHAERVLAKIGVSSRGRVAAALRAAYDADQATGGDASA
jgi:DNA-binding NarL/FixJ family response regulator